jgi:magnesium-transporting ATPase (P-type)
MFGFDAGWESDDYGHDEVLHFTFFFNTFVFLQIFNEINCRKLGCDEWNVFSKFFNNWLFLAVIIITIVC